MQTLFKLAAHLPLRLLRALGLVLGIAAWLGSPRFRRDFDIQWSQANRFWREAQDRHPRPPDETPTPNRLAAIAESGVLFTELPKIWCRPETALAMQSSGFLDMQAALARGKGLIILTPHLGAFELAARRIAREFPLTVLYRPARRPQHESLIKSFRNAEGVRPVPANAQGVRQLMRSLRQGQAIGLLPDQVPSEGDGLVADFFGRPAYTMTLPIRLAQATGAAVAWATALRTPSGWSLTLEPWTIKDDHGNTQLFSDLLPTLTLDAAVGLMNHAIEDRIARAPAQYLWAYNRYKRLAS